jgi:5-methylcytosine-specific restriction endonuclease McrA
MKLCTKCGEQKIGLRCKPCYNAQRRDWYARNREKEIARCSAYNKANPDVPAAAMRKARANNPEKYATQFKLWRKSNSDLVAIYDANKRAKRRIQIQATLNPITKDDWLEIKNKYKHHCAYCLKPCKKLSMDHVVALARGGDHSASNIVPACIPCNTKKNAKDNLDFVARAFGRLV